MRAVTLEPRNPGSLKLEDVPEPDRDRGSILVRTRAIGVCGTDRELIDAHYGEAPSGRRRLILGHESLGRVVDAPPHSGFAIGDSVVGIVRHPDPVPCANCAAGEWDMCTNGGYTERGIKGADGFGAEFFALKPGFAIQVDAKLDVAAVLLEPASVLAKAWEHIEHIARRALWQPGRLLVTGAGPVGLLAALMGVQRGFAVHVQDHNEKGLKPALVNSLGARYSVAPPKDDFDVIIECTGAPAVIKQVHVQPHRLPGWSFRDNEQRWHRRGRLQPIDGARQRRGLRHGERQPPPLRGRRRGARPRRAFLARPPHYAQGASYQMAKSI
jgi:threonine dehydrogenase-like Zn-dependent dehydrogenase